MHYIMQEIHQHGFLYRQAYMQCMNYSACRAARSDFLNMHLPYIQNMFLETTQNILCGRVLSTGNYRDN